MDKYVDGGIYWYDEQTLLLFEKGLFWMFGWEVPFTLSDRETESTILEGKIGALVVQLPTEQPSTEKP